MIRRLKQWRPSRSPRPTAADFVAADLQQWRDADLVAAPFTLEHGQFECRGVVGAKRRFIVRQVLYDFDNKTDADSRKLFKHNARVELHVCQRRELSLPALTFHYEDTLRLARLLRDAPDDVSCRLLVNVFHRERSLSIPLLIPEHGLWELKFRLPPAAPQKHHIGGVVAVLGLESEPAS